MEQHGDEKTRRKDEMKWKWKRKWLTKNLFTWINRHVQELHPNRGFQKVIE